MARLRRTLDLLPEIFRTETNEKFLNATLEQLVQEPDLRRVDGYIGRRTGLGVDGRDSYVLETNNERTTYQLEPTVCWKYKDQQKTRDFLTYPGMLDALKVHGANVSRHDRLFESEYYSWDPFVDYDKFVNFSQYYWLPQGPDSVDVSATAISTSDDYTVTRNEFDYSLSGVEGRNPTITVVRGGNYKFNVQQTGNPFYIQTYPGASGKIPGQENQSSREVFGVTNNGDDNGIIEFNVPLDDAQDFFLSMPITDKVDLVTNLRFDEINNQYVRTFLDKYDGIDEVTDLRGRTIIFTNKNTGSGDESGWQREERYDENKFDENDHPFSETEDILIKSDRYSVWRIEYLYEDADGDRFDETGNNPYMVLRRVRDVPELTKVHVQYGTRWNNEYFWKTKEGFFEKQPLITAVNDTLYYQDSNDENRFGIIRVVDAIDQLTLNVGDDIIGQKEYTSPTGVTFTNGLKVQFRGGTFPESYQDLEYYVEGVGESIKLIRVEDLKTPETYTVSETEPFDVKGFDEAPWDSSLNAPTNQDYLTINRASPDQNPWSRSNRWFHISVIKYSAELNKTIADLDQTARAKRPIIEFNSGLRLFNFGTEGKRVITIIDRKQTDALSNVAGKIGYSVDGVGLFDGARIIFANDADPEVRNKIYEVRLVDPKGLTVDPNQTSEDIIQLIKAEDGEVSKDQVVFLSSGATLQGKSYRFTGTEWVEAQQKTDVNQAPLFDIFDSNGNSIGDNIYYPSTNFIGTKLFSYADGTGPLDPVLNIRLKYQNINNVGDIVFDNSLYKDTFVYTVNNISTTTDVANGFIRKYQSREDFVLETGWKKAVYNNRQAQVFSFKTNSFNEYIADVRYEDTNNAVIVYVNNSYVLPELYQLSRTSNTTTIRFNEPLSENSLVHIHILSDQVTEIGYYELPSNLTDNSVNEEFESVTLGTIRNHFVGLAQSHPGLTGTILGENNLRDLGNVAGYGKQIVEQSSPLQFTATFSKDSDINFFDSIEYASKEYEKFKNRLVDTLTKNDYQGTPSERLDQAINDLNKGRNSSMPFYWADTMPSGEIYDEATYKITPIDDNVFDLLRTYDYTKANYQALLVYVNDEQLLKDTDYTVATDGPRLTINKTLNQGDVIRIREYESTVGSFVPPTPTKLGMFDRFQPLFFTDDSYSTPQLVLQGHDGSRTIAFGDNRDEVLLEFERRIYNNIKVDRNNIIPLRWYDVIPGAFRKTDYSLGEITELLGSSFLSWVAWNNLDYKTQEYDKDNKKTWNYSSSTNRLNGELLQGGWRANLYQFYDTDVPHLRPWEMFGFSEEPSWWQRQYGPPPYTGENMVLWDDMANGVVAHPDGDYVVEEFKRPGLQSIIPTGDEGELEASFDVLVANYDTLSTRKSWQVGDMGPVETAWRRSSAWPFAIMKLLAQTKPAQFFGLMSDRDRYKYSSELEQYVYDSRFRLTSKNIDVYGDGQIKHSYINWCVDYAKRQGISNTQAIIDIFRNTKIQLVYRVGGYTDKQYLKIFTEKTSPNSLNSNLLLPDESYEILLYKNEPMDEVTYSSVIIQKVSDGYAVYGNSKEDLYFTIFQSVPNGNYKNVTVGDDTYRLSLDFSNKEVRVPYGYVFTNPGAVIDFLVSYGSWLESKGFIFEDKENQYLLNWNQMVQEFMYWNQQGWGTGSIINLNPAANELKVEKPGTIASPILGRRADEFVLNQNLQPLQKDNLVWDRIDNRLTIKTLDENSINFVKIKFTNFEHALVFDNTSIFNDLMYDPSTGSRQQRLKISGIVTNNWDGTVNAPGFVMNQPNVEEWTNNKEYSKGDIVLYKNIYYTALNRISPSETFNFSNWSETEYENIKTGLIPNLALKSDESIRYYNINEANLETDSDLLGFGLIGFRPRDYMQGLNLNDVSQTNVYRDFIKNKGSSFAMDLFKNVRLEKERSDYSIYENWAVLTGNYGATANRSYVEAQLNSDKLTGNPATIKMSPDLSDTTVNQIIRPDEIYKSSYKITDSNILPTINYANIDNSLPSAGFVNIDHSDLNVFDLNELDSLLESVGSITEGTKIWVAKDNANSWNIYRVSLLEAEPYLITDNLNGTCVVRFNGHHHLSPGDIVVIKYLAGGVDGAYRVKEAPQLDKIVIYLTLPEEITAITNLGVAFILQSAKVEQASDIADLPFVKELRTGEKIWVDQEKWKVLEKFNPFNNPSATFSKIVETPQSDQEVGYSVSQTPSGQTALVGAPGYDNDKGAVYVFGELPQGDIQEGTRLRVTKATSNLDKEISRFGESVASGQDGWSIAGAPESMSGEGFAVVIKQLNNGVIFENQILTMPGATGFGKSVAMSRDSKWAYVGAPADEKVYVYQLVPSEIQRFETRGVVGTQQWNIAEYITADTAEQLTINIDNIIQVPNVDYTYTGTVVEFTEEPRLGSKIEIVRNYVLPLLGDGSTTEFDVSKIYQADNIEKFKVVIDDEILRPGYDYTFNSSTKEITLTLTDKSGNSIAPPDNSFIQVIAIDYYTLVDTIENPALATDPTPGDYFGLDISATTDGAQVVIGATTSEGLDDNDGNPTSNVGKAFVFDLDIERFLVRDHTTTLFTPVKTIQGYPTVTVNNEQLSDADRYLYTDGYTVTGNTVSIDPTKVKIGDVVEISTNNFVLIEELEMSGKVEGSQFGFATKVCNAGCSVYIGAPTDSTLLDKSGSVTRFVNRSRLYGSIEGTPVYDVNGNLVAPTLTQGHALRINNYVVEVGERRSDTDGNLLSWVQSFIKDINEADIPNVVATETSLGQLSIKLKNPSAAPTANKLFIYPSSGTVISDLGLTIFPEVQTIHNPYPITNARFGHSLDISNDSLSIIIGAPNGATDLEVTFDNDETVLDSGATKVKDLQVQSGAVYTYDYLNSAENSFINPGKFVFGQQIADRRVHPLSQFGASVDYSNAKLLIGAPGFNRNYGLQQYIDLDDDGLADDLNPNWDIQGRQKEGRIVRFVNEDYAPVWQVIEEQREVVDTELIDTVLLYDKTTDRVVEYLDYIDPLQGKILGAAKQNIDLIIPNDPAGYNRGIENNFGQTWGVEKVGTVWWDISNARFINYYQSTADYRAKRVGQLFPGSTIDVYQWISSSVPPSEYQGEGEVYSVDSYSVLSDVKKNGEIAIQYYFWVKGITSIAKNAKKTLSVATIAQYIENPKTSGIPYISLIDTDSIALFNTQDKITNTDTILHVEFDKIKTENRVHNEYELIREKDATQFLSNNLYRKFLDSFCGTDIAGNIVPDPNLSITDKRGVQFRPRQTMFVDRFNALRNYLTAVNRIIKKLPITEIRSYPLLFSEETIPSKPSNTWDITVKDIAELSYQTTNIDPIGTRYLVEVDETNNNLWSIYTLQSNRTLLLTRVQNYRTTRYWSLVDWYAEDYNVLARPTLEVNQYADLSTLTSATLGTVVKVHSNAQGKFEIYRLDTTGWTRVGLEKGTIKFNSSIYDYNIDRNGFDNEVFDAQYFDQEAVIETRQIIKSINEELFINDLATHRIELIILMFNYVLSEQKSTDWLVKTSLIDVQHNLRDLEQYKILKRDNQDFIEGYLNEVKPYRTQIKEFNLVYNGNDLFQGDATDFDLPAKFDVALNKYISPRHVLSNENVIGEGVYSLDNSIWSRYEYADWRQNFSLSIESVNVIDSGSGYTSVPQVIVEGECDIPAEMTARVSTAGEIYAINVDYPGVGYTTTPVITFKGGNGEGAKAAAVTAPGDVRSYKTTIKFDRYEHVSNVIDWTAETAYDKDQLVRFNNKVYRVTWGNGSTLSKTTFDPLDYELVDSSELSGVDRTMGLYQPGANYPGLDLSLLVYGTEYPGINMLGPDFSQNTGLDVGNFDINPFDNLDFDENGKPSYSETILDTKYLGGNYTGSTAQEIYNIDIENKDFDLTTANPDAMHGDSNFEQDDPWLWTWESDFYRSTGGTNVQDPELVLKRGSTYKFRNFTAGHNLWLRTQPLSEEEYLAGKLDLYKLTTADGVINNGAKREMGGSEPGIVTWTIPLDYPLSTVTIQHSQFGMDDTIRVAGEIINSDGSNRPSDIDVDGGSFVDSYNSHAPQELVPGAIFDTLNITINTRPGEDYTSNGWSGPSQTKFFDFNENNRTISFAGLVDVPFAVLVFEVDAGEQLIFEYGDTPVNTVDYTINWNDHTITLTDGRFSSGDIIGITAHGVGGGNQLLVEDYTAGVYLTTENTADIVIPVAHDQIKNVEVLVNGEKITNWTLETYEEYHTKIRIGNRDLTGNGSADTDMIANGQTRGLLATDYIQLAVLGYRQDEIPARPTYLLEYNSDLETEVSYPMVDSFYVTDTTKYTYKLENNVFDLGVSAEIAIVTLNGNRLRPPEGLEWVGDGLTVDYVLNLDTFTGQGTIADNDVSVYQNNRRLRLYDDYILSPFDGSSDRIVTFSVAPADGDNVKIFVYTEADYQIDRVIVDGDITESNLQIKSTGQVLRTNDHISVTGFGITNELDGITRVYQGPTQSGFTSRQSYDSVGFDSGTFDLQVGVTIDQSVYFLNRNITLPERLMVHVNGKRKFYGTDWKMLEGDDRYIEFYSLEVGPSDIVTVTMRTENIVPGPSSIQLFKDMRDVSGIWRFGEETTTVLTQQVNKTDDFIYVRDASKLPTPNLDNGIFGFIMIGSERISYKYIDRTTNIISGLRRGIHGTAITTHPVDSEVVNMSSGEYLNWPYTRTWYDLTGTPLSVTDTVPAKFLRRAN